MDIKESSYIDILTRISSVSPDKYSVGVVPLIATIDHAFLTDIRGHWPQQVSFLWSHATEVIDLAEFCDALTLVIQGATLMGYDQPGE